MSSRKTRPKCNFHSTISTLRPRRLCTALAVGSLWYLMGTAGVGYASDGCEILGNLGCKNLSIRAVVRDANDFIYVGGKCRGSLGADAEASVLQSYDDAVIIKLDSSGRNMWSRRFAGIQNNACNALGVDAEGNVFVTGYCTGEIAFDQRSLESKLPNTLGTSDAFIAKVSSGGDLAWIRVMGGNLNDAGQCLVVDASGNVCVAGNTGGTVRLGFGNEDVSPKTLGADNVFVAKLDTDGRCIWVKTVGGQGAIKPYGIGVDRTGAIALSGIFAGQADFDPGTADTETHCEGSFDAFVLRLECDGQLAWVHTIGGKYRDSCRALAMDADGNVFVTGAFAGTLDFDPGPGRAMFQSESIQKGYLLKLDRAGKFAWAKESVNPFENEGECVALDRAGRVYWVSEHRCGEGPVRGSDGGRVHIEVLTADGGEISSETDTRMASDSVFMAAPDGRGELILAGSLTVAGEGRPEKTTEPLATAGLVRFKMEPELLLAESTSSESTISD